MLRILLVAANKLINTNSQHFIGVYLTCLTVALFSDFCVFIIRLSLGACECLGILVLLDTVHVSGAVHNK